jgi:hypothetical protein
MFLLLLLYTIEREREIYRTLLEVLRATSIYVQEKHQSQRCSSNNNNKATKEREQQQQQTPKKADGAQLLWVMTFFFFSKSSTDEQNKTRSLQKSKD